MVMTARQVVDTILASVPGAPLADTVDTFKAGDPDAEVRGVATTFLATLDVLKWASDLGANMVITHEPTYYGHRDETGWLEGDPVYEAKRRFVAESGLIVWRFHDHWHRHVPDGITAGVVARLGWTPYQDAADPWRFRLPECTLAALARTVKERLGARVVRVTGKQRMRCSRVALAPGSVPAAMHIAVLRRDDVDVLICGESHEWEACEYVRDALSAGRRKALINAGHCNSEEPGMEYLVDWLRARLPAGIPVTFVPAGDPFWTV